MAGHSRYAIIFIFCSDTLKNRKENIRRKQKWNRST